MCLDISESLHMSKCFGPNKSIYLYFLETPTFEVQTLVLCATCCLINENKGANISHNTSTDDMVQISKFNCHSDLDLLAKYLGLAHNLLYGTSQFYYHL